jgi:predicted membrane protein
MKTFLYIIIFLFLYWLQANLFNTSVLANATILIVTLLAVNRHSNNESTKKENKEIEFLKEKNNHYLEQLKSYSKGEMHLYEKERFEEEYLDDSEIIYYKKNQNINK